MLWCALSLAPRCERASGGARLHPLRMVDPIDVQQGAAPAAAFGAETIKLTPGSATFLVGALIKRDRYKTLQNSWTIDDSLDELQRLSETAGLEVLGREYQTMQHPSASSFIGQGKLQELAATVSSMRITTVVFDDELSPGQSRNIQKVLGGDVQVIDRTMLILFIFAQRARTREAKLQVAAAQMKYMLPRLSTFLTEGAGLDSKGGSTGGGGGQFMKGAGESQLEVDRRLFRKQLGRIEASIAEVQTQRDAYREKRRERDMLPVVAIVGYTNAGKSTLLNSLVGKREVYADDLLFATLDPTTRRVALPGGKEVLISDTVGFIQKLPTKLIASFRATLDELADATLVVHVVDASSPLAIQQVRSVNGIVTELDAKGTPQILVLNKVGRRSTNGSIARARPPSRLLPPICPCRRLDLTQQCACPAPCLPLLLA
jgi:GTP-binding protein HflX